ncbi:MAG: hypothetical protein LUC88_03315 [Prevotella sp.]|nr:hypothetical protein [Prevotella sp.]
MSYAYEKCRKIPNRSFCHDYEDKSEGVKSPFKQQYCKYIKSTCVKPRKSQPDIKVGICSLGATVNNGKVYKPVIICPQRFKEDYMFETIRQKYLNNWNNVKWIPEVYIGVGGSVDYVAVEIDSHNNISNFLCVELQAGGTTGTPYPAVKDLMEFGKYKRNSYNYGINWANEFSKTMMQQAYKKGKIVEHWNRKIVFVVQDLAMEYIFASSDCSKVTRRNPKYPVDFCTFKMVWHETEWKLEFDKIRSTTIAGINTILGGAKPEDYLTEEEFVQNIIKKGIKDGILDKNIGISPVI